MNTPSSLADKVFGGAIVMIALRMAVRLLGLVSISITARLLTPDDFGVFGTAGIALSLFGVLSNAGLNEVLIRLKSVDQSHVHTVWTLQFVLRLAVTLSIVAVAPLAGDFLQEPRAEAVLYALAVVPTLEALASPASPMFFREFNFRREFAFRLSHKAVAVVAAIVAAWVVGDYWALVYAQLFAAIALIVISQAFFPYLPRPTFLRLKEIAGFSFWSFGRAIATYVATMADEYVVRRVSGTTEFGYYHTGRGLSRTLVTELIAPAATPLLAALSRLQDQPARFASAVTSAVGVALLVGMPIGIGVAVTAKEIVVILLGNQWIDAAPLLVAFALGVAAQTIGGLGRSVYSALDKQHYAAMSWTARAVFMAAGCVVAGVFGNAATVAWTFAGINVAATFIEYAFIYRHLGRPYPIFSLYFLPLSGGAAMAVSIILFPMPITWPSFVLLLAKAAIGAAVYLTCVITIWHLMGKPTGPVSALGQRLPKPLGRLLS